ncbi:hypothetical protein HYO44_17610 [Vibrio parahaemolyticus]|nr:hypothetical protein [Vibrio parahaemolyticus]
MKRTQKINSNMYKLLIENNMDDFSVVEARDIALSFGGMPNEPDEARKVIYRQILRFEQKGWLIGSGKGRCKRYRQTEEFKSLSVVCKREKTAKEIDELVPSFFYGFSVLSKERKEYEGELEIKLVEVEEYKALSRRFPAQRSIIVPMLNDAKGRAAILLGRINAISKVLNTISDNLA